MPRVLARAIRLVKIGAVAGALVGVGRLILRRKRMADAGESSWPTIGETAAQNGQPVDDESDADSSEPSAEAGASEAEHEDGAGNDTNDDEQN